MYVIGELRAVISAQVAAWDWIAIRRTVKGAEALCTTPKHFYFKANRNGQIGEKVWPRR